MDNINKDKSNKKNSGLSFILNRLNSYEDYFHILGLNRNIYNKETSIDEEKDFDKQVHDAYVRQMRNLEKMFKDYSNLPGYLEVKEKFETTLKDAYNALKDRNSRKNYIELLEKINGEER